MGRPRKANEKVGKPFAFRMTPETERRLDELVEHLWMSPRIETRCPKCRNRFTPVDITSGRRAEPRPATRADMLSWLINKTYELEKRMALFLAEQHDDTEGE